MDKFIVKWMFIYGKRENNQLFFYGRYILDDIMATI